ncbi:hypothetical protein CR513_19438, partial [Mucuna pruriens]
MSFVDGTIVKPSRIVPLYQSLLRNNNIASIPHKAKNLSGNNWANANLSTHVIVVEFSHDWIA